MKATVERSEPPKTFIPIKLEIVIETPEELMELWHRVNNNQLSESYIRSLKESEYNSMGIYYSGIDGTPTAFESIVAGQIFDLITPYVNPYNGK